MKTYTCESCGDVFQSEWSDEEAQTEAAAAFTETELTDTAIVCEICWQEMRRTMPDMDARYASSTGIEPKT